MTNAELKAQGLRRNPPTWAERDAKERMAHSAAVWCVIVGLALILACAICACPRIDKNQNQNQGQHGPEIIHDPETVDQIQWRPVRFCSEHDEPIALVKAQQWQTRREEGC